MFSVLHLAVADICTFLNYELFFNHFNFYCHKVSDKIDFFLIP